MNKYLNIDEWNIIETNFNPENQRSSESIFSLGNGRMGQRANFEEFYTGNSLQGSYIAGIYYPDKTRVGWWKNGYPQYFAKVLNSPNWIGINILIDETYIDLAKWKIIDFKRVLNMRDGTLSRNYIVSNNNKKAEVNCIRFLSMKNQNIGVIKFSVKLLDSAGKITMVPYLDGDICNEDSNYNELFWDVIQADVAKGKGYIEAKTRKTDFVAGFSMRYEIMLNGKSIKTDPETVKSDKYVANSVSVDLKKDDTITIIKYVAVVSSLYSSPENIRQDAEKEDKEALSAGFDKLYKEHSSVWEEIWQSSDIKIEGDAEAQQGIRFNIFQLYQTYRGDDPRLNIGPKGFTGEKYGGSTYWDTEAFCLPFFLCTAPQHVVKNLLVYRYKHLDKAIENAVKLGFDNGAAMYPMVTMNGEECHNEWEITFEEIHRNGAIAFAIYNYIIHTGDESYLSEYGLEVLIGISRFWSQRVNYSEVKKQYVILGVTGPNEYENNVNNNWYTNTIAKWCMEYTITALNVVKKSNPERYSAIVSKTAFNENIEPAKWTEISENLYIPFESSLNIYLQQEGYMDKEQMLAKDIDPGQRPINQHWSWDRILRSCFIKQADVLMGFYLFEENYDTETIRRHFDFYESRTVHESSLSACIHSVLASRIGKVDKAYELYLRTSRLDLDDYNNEVKEGLHITSMAGTWLSIVEGFGGKRIKNNLLSFVPVIPAEWQNYSFKVVFRGVVILVTVNKDEIIFKNESQQDIKILVYDQSRTIKGLNAIKLSNKQEVNKN